MFVCIAILGACMRRMRRKRAGGAKPQLVRSRLTAKQQRRLAMARLAVAQRRYAPTAPDPVDAEGATSAAEDRTATPRPQHLPQRSPLRSPASLRRVSPEPMRPSTRPSPRPPSPIGARIAPAVPGVLIGRTPLTLVGRPSQGDSHRFMDMLSEQLAAEHAAAEQLVVGQAATVPVVDSEARRHIPRQSRIPALEAEVVVIAAVVSAAEAAAEGVAAAEAAAAEAKALEAARLTAEAEAKAKAEAVAAEEARLAAEAEALEVARLASEAAEEARFTEAEVAEVARVAA